MGSPVCWMFAFGMIVLFGMVVVFGMAERHRRSQRRLVGSLVGLGVPKREAVEIVARERDARSQEVVRGGALGCGAGAVGLVLTALATWALSAILEGNEVVVLPVGAAAFFALLMIAGTGQVFLGIDLISLLSSDGTGAQEQATAVALFALWCHSRAQQEGSPAALAAPGNRAVWRVTGADAGGQLVSRDVTADTREEAVAAAILDGLDVRSAERLAESTGPGDAPPDAAA